MSAECSTCGGTNISENNFCEDCGSVVCHVCGNTGEDDWDEPQQEDGEWVSYCKDCGSEVRADHKMF